MTKKPNANATAAIATPAAPGLAIPGVVLAGGLSSRMGADKARVPLGGVPLVERALRRLEPQVCALAISTNDTAAPELRALGLPLLGDPDGVRSGPIGGVLAALRHAGRAHPAASHVATVPTDSPFFPASLVARLSEAARGPEDIAFATSSGGAHPVFALWPVALADDLAHWMRSADTLRLRSWLARHEARAVAFADCETAEGPLDPFFNVNTPADLERAEFWLRTLSR